MYNDYYLQEINSKLATTNSNLQTIIKNQETIIQNQETNYNTLCACEMILAVLLIFLFIVRSLK